MQYKIISFADIGKCPQHRLDPQHWLDGHKCEECHPELIKQVKAKEAELSQQATEEIERVRAKQKADLETFKKVLRDKS